LVQIPFIGGETHVALILCPKHGRGCSAVCSHVAVLVWAGAPVRQSLVPMCASYEGQVLGPTWLCPECAARFGVPAEGVTLEGEEGFDRFWGEVDWRPVCPGCFEACRVGDGEPPAAADSGGGG
jgi:hypothetical protein